MEYPKWIEKAEELYKQSISFAKIGEELKVDRKLVSYYLQKKGYEPNHKYITKNYVIQKTQKAVDANSFENIDSEEKAYWLGFLMADGCVFEKRNSIELSLKEEDLEHLKKFKRFMKSEHKISKKIKHGKYVGYRITITNKKIKKDLINNECIPNKTKNMKFPNIEKNLYNHFIRGYFDGDGSIVKHSTAKISLEILGHKEFLSEIANFFGVEGHVYSFNHSSISRFMIAGKKANEIMKCLYKDSTIHLERKYNKYLQLAVLFQPS